MKKITKILENYTEKSGKNAFPIFLKIVDKFGNVFIKGRDFLEHGLFFHSDKIEDNESVFRELELRESFKYATEIFSDIANKKLFFYFSLENEKIHYGFCNEDDKVFPIGEFIPSTYQFKSLPKCEGLCNIDIIKDFNLKSLIFLNKIKKDFEGFEKGEVKIINDKVIRMTCRRDELPYDDDQLSVHLNYWVHQQSWKRKVYNYIDIEEDVKFYLKVK